MDPAQIPADKGTPEERVRKIFRDALDEAEAAFAQRRWTDCTSALDVAYAAFRFAAMSAATQTVIVQSLNPDKKDS